MRREERCSKMNELWCIYVTMILVLQAGPVLSQKSEIVSQQSWACGCEENKCLPNEGRCQSDVKCKPNNFGLYCQLVRKTDSELIPELSDGDLSTCMKNDNKLKITMTEAVPRYIEISFQELDKSVVYEFDSESFNGTCPSVQFTEKTLLFDCRDLVQRTTEYITFKGPPMTRICEFKVAPGRFYFPTIIASSYNGTAKVQVPWDSPEGITLDKEQNPHVNLTFTYPIIVNEIKFQRLEGSPLDFSIEYYGPNKEYYKEMHSTGATVYYIYPEKVQFVSTLVTITAVNTTVFDYKRIVLNADCPVGQIGLNCTIRCHESCKDGRCTQTGHCLETIEGFKPCTEFCLHENCQEGAPICPNQCVDGFFGKMCQKECNRLCAKGRICDIEGRCIHGCTSGFTGPYCQERCSETCGGPEKECDIQNTCLHGCVPGYTGQDCTKLCSKDCAQTECYMNGTCMHGCMPGFFGLNCSSKCNENCAQDKSCDLKGTCVHGCNPGLTGADCSKQCSANCAQDKACYMNGTCIHGCSVGNYGATCSKLCSAACAEDKSCDVSGKCVHGCIGGFFGQTCSSACSPHCQMPNVCDSSSGKCKGKAGASKCKSGLVGDDCLKLGFSMTEVWHCHCAGAKCVNVGEKCFDGSKCLQGFYGASCQHRDIATFATVSLDLINDTGEAVCNTMGNKSISADWDRPQFVVSIQLGFSLGASVKDFTVEHSQDSSTFVACKQPKEQISDNAAGMVIELDCHKTFMCKSLRVSWEGEGDICSLQVSGGTNVVSPPDIVVVLRGSKRNGTGGGTEGGDGGSALGGTGESGDGAGSRSGVSKGDVATTKLNDGSLEKDSCVSVSTFVSFQLVKKKKVYKLILYKGDPLSKAEYSVKLMDAQHKVVLHLKDHLSTEKLIEEVTFPHDMVVHAYDIIITSGALSLCEVELLGERLSNSPTWLCHCEGGKCVHENGQCAVNTKCSSGYYGMACQQRDIALSATVSVNLYNENGEPVCQKIPDKRVTADWDKEQHIVSLRLLFSPGAMVKKFNFEYRRGSDDSLKCYEPMEQMSDDGTDIVIELDCIRTYQAKSLKVTWEGEGDLCLFQVSGGSNVNIHQDIIFMLRRPTGGGAGVGDHGGGTGGDGVGSGSDFGMRDEVIALLNDGSVDKDSCVLVNTVVIVKLVKKITAHKITLYKGDTTNTGEYSIKLMDADLKEVLLLPGIKTTDNLLEEVIFPPNVTLSVYELIITSGTLNLCEVEMLGLCTPPGYGYGCVQTCPSHCNEGRCLFNGQCYYCGATNSSEANDGRCFNRTQVKVKLEGDDKTKRFTLNPSWYILFAVLAAMVWLIVVIIVKKSIAATKKNEALSIKEEVDEKPVVECEHFSPVEEEPFTFVARVDSNGVIW